METKTVRGPNFTEQENILLCELMGEKHSKITSMNNHQVDKARFGSGITKDLKKDMWKELGERFNACGTVRRDAAVLQKKWDNLVPKHRTLFSDYKRELALTGGGGPADRKCTILTHAVMDVIGRDTVSVSGAVLAHFDTSFNQLKQSETAGSEETTEANFNGTCTALEDSRPVATGSAEPTLKGSCHCSCHKELDILRKRKLILQIQCLEAKLKKKEE